MDPAVRAALDDLGTRLAILETGLGTTQGITYGELVTRVNHLTGEVSRLERIEEAIEGHAGIHQDIGSRMITAEVAFRDLTR